MNDVPVVVVAQVPQVHVETKTVEITQLQPVAQVPRVLVVEKTTEIPQFQVADKVVDVLVVSVMQVPRVCAVKKTSETPQLQVVDVPVVFVVQAPLVQVRVVMKTVEDSQLQIVEKTIENPETQISDACLTCDVKCKVACETCVKDNMFMVTGEMTVAGKRDHETVAHKSDYDCGRFFRVDGTSGSMHQQHAPGQAEEERKMKKTGEGGQRGEGEKGRERKKGKERAVEEQECKQVKKDATGWTKVTRNKRERKMVQIFVKVDGMKTVVMEVSPEDKVQKILNTVSKSDRDVYVTSGGRTLKGGDKLKSCEVRDGSTVEITSRMRGGGRHKDKKSKVEKKEGMKQEPLKNEGPAILESEKEAVIRMLEETEEYRKTIESICDGSDVEVEQALQNYRTAGREVLGWNQGQADMMECGLRWAVEARREGKRQQEEEQRRQRKQGQHPGQEESKQGKQVRFGEEQRLGKTGAENAGEPEVMGRTTEVRTGRGSAGLARGGDEGYRADETSRKGKGKGNGGKGEHEGKGGGFGHSGKQQETREKEEERFRMAPNMGAGGSHPQATSDPGEGEMAEGNDEKEEGNQENGEEKEETRGMRWADCEDDEGEKNKEEQETEEERQEEGKKEQEAERKQKQEQEQGGDREKEAEEKKEQEEESRAQEAREEERGERRWRERSRGERRKRERKKQGLRRSNQERRERLRKSEKKREKLRPRKGTKKQKK